jgi:membrane protease subunit (stomatin/prohibitin family)
MDTYNINQEIKDLRWGTRMPVALMIGSDFFEVRARGTISLVVKDVQRLQAKVPDASDLTAYLGSLLAMAITDLIGGLSAQVSTLAQLTTPSESTSHTFQAQLEPKLDELGLRIQTLKIEAIESI